MVFVPPALLARLEGALPESLDGRLGSQHPVVLVLDLGIEAEVVFADDLDLAQGVLEQSRVVIFSWLLL